MYLNYGTQLSTVSALLPTFLRQGFCFSDDRSPDVFKTRIEAATQMKSVLGANEKPNCLIIDEIDGAPMVRENFFM